MPPRKAAKGKRGGGATKATSSRDAPSASRSSRRSKLAKENDITAEEETEIKEAWSLFRLDDVDGYEDEKEGVIRTRDVEDAMRAQGLAPGGRSQMQEFLETLDPDSAGYVTYPHFLALCALQLRSKTDESRDEEVRAAFGLFRPTGHGVADHDQTIRLQDLRAVARTLREDVSDDVLKAMILEANGGRGVGGGVTLDDFRAIITRAGVFQ